MKKTIIVISILVAFIFLLSEPDLTFSNFIIKLLSLFWIWLVAKVNNYFYEKKGE